jgi:hypothetical protein
MKGTRMITIENEQFVAGIRIKGAELASLRDKSTGRELIWQADPEVWGGSAPILFPIIGKLKDGITRINGKSYEIPKHGVLRVRSCIPELPMLCTRPPQTTSLRRSRPLRENHKKLAEKRKIAQQPN